ncbi:hypothetical protein Q1695_002339 [Nippostrongylus brasiliensis]|nr:hypothetical protein Q1695_002339 [Nippostrongylus brasiliensis]
MQNPSRSVCIIENAIDRLIDYGDRIHAAYGRQNELERIRQLDISVCGKKGGTGQASSVWETLDISVCGKKGGTGQASSVWETSIVSEKETVNQFFYTVTKGNRRCTIPGKMYSKRLPDSWVHINFVLFDEDGSELLNLNTDIMQEALRNTFVNGKPVTFVQ